MNNLTFLLSLIFFFIYSPLIPQGVVVQFRFDKLGNVVNVISEGNYLYLGLNQLDSLS